MTSTVRASGRLCNHIFRNIAVHFIAEKHNLDVIYGYAEEIEKLGIPLCKGTRRHKNILTLTDNNYHDILNTSHLDSNLVGDHAFFQTNSISMMIYEYLRRDSIKHQIMIKNPFKERYNQNNDVFLHIRLTDTAHLNPGVGYYETALSLMEYNNLFIATDDPKHAIIRELLLKFPIAKIVELDLPKTIQFGSTCQKIILSHGSMSAIIGYLGFFSQMYYPAYEYTHEVWFGDMFSIDTWTKVPRPL
jgi:hypothetical protein